MGYVEAFLLSYIFVALVLASGFSEQVAKSKALLLAPIAWPSPMLALYSFLICRGRLLEPDDGPC